MPLEPLPVPFRGVANSVPPRSQPSEFTRPPNLRNIRIDPRTGRAARRFALKKAFGGVQLGAGRPVQAMTVVSRAQTFTGFGTGTAQDLTGWESRVSGALAGNIWLLDKNWAMARDRYEDVTAAGPYGDSGPAGNSVSKVAINPAGTRVAYATNYVDGTGRTVTRIGVVDAAYLFRGGPLLPGYPAFPFWSRKFDIGPIAPNTTRTFCLRYSPGGEYLFAGVNDTLYVLDPGSGATLATNQMEGWSGSEVTSAYGKICFADCWTDPAGAQFLFVGFNGKTDSGLTGGGITISSDHYGSMFRAGVMKFSIAPGTPSAPLAKVNFGNGLPAGSTFWEADHGYFRISEQSVGIPHGCYINDGCVGPDGSVYVARTNQGGGPNSSYPPDGDAPYITVCKIGSNGVMQWEKDTQSIKAANFGGFANDFDVGGTDYPAHAYTVDPSILCLAADPSNTIFNRSVYAAGRRTGATATTGFNLFRLLQTNGSQAWRKNLSGTVRDVTVDPTDNQVVAAGDRNSDWDGSSGAADLQHLWKLARFDAAVTRKYDLATASLDALGVAVNPADGTLVYVSEKR